MAVNDYREPIEYVVNQYFERAKMLNKNLEGGKTSLGMGQDFNEKLPETPVELIWDEKERLVKAIYGEVDLLYKDEEADPIIWQEELVRDINGNVTKLITTYPDGETAENVFERNPITGKLERYG